MYSSRNSKREKYRNHKDNEIITLSEVLKYVELENFKYRSVKNRNYIIDKSTLATAFLGIFMSEFQPLTKQ